MILSAPKGVSAESLNTDLKSAGGTPHYLTWGTSVAALKPMTASIHIRPFRLSDEDEVVALWRQCNLVRPTNDPHKDIRRKLRVRPDLFLVSVLEEKIVGSVMAGYEGHRGWLNYVAVAPQHQRTGIGRALIEEAERLLRAEGCPKINLQVRTTNQGAVEFYRQVGYALDDVVSMGKRLEHDGP